MIKKKRYNSYNKKGIVFSLEALVGTILSTIALIFIMTQMLALFFMETPTNEQIVNNNMKSINEFIEFSNERFSDVNNNCYTMLKLKNLENFQFDINNNKNYFIVISETEISSHPLSELSKIDTINDFDKIEILNKDKLKVPVELYLDDTSDSILSVSVYGQKMGSLQNNLVLNKKINKIVLIPNYKMDLWFVEAQFGPIKSNQNIIVGRNYYEIEGSIVENSPLGVNTESNDIYIKQHITYPKGFYLGYNPISNKLFLSNSEYSNTFLNYRSCAIENLMSDDYDGSIKENPKYADFINDKLTFDCYSKDLDIGKDFKFIWSIKGIECPENEGKDCKDYLNEDYNDLTYGEFLDKLSKFYLENNKDCDIMKLVDIEPLSLKELEDGKIDDINYDLNKMFIEYDNKVKVLEGDGKKYLDKNFGDLIFEGLRNKNMKTYCNHKVCDYIGFKDSIAYFYDIDIDNFVYFDINFLRKDIKGNYYYKGRKLNLESAKDDFDDFGFSFFRENFNFYTFNIETEKGLKTIVLTDFQLNMVKRGFKNEN